MSAEIRLDIRRSAFRDRLDQSVLPHRPGKGLGYYLDDLGYTVPTGCNAVVAVQSSIGDHNPKPEEWDNFIPRPGDRIIVNTLPGKGGGGGKSPLQTLTSIASLALMFAAPEVVPLAFLSASPIAALPRLTWGAIAGFGLNVVGGLLTQPPKPSLSGLSRPGGMAPSSPTYKIDDAGNQMLQYGKLPRPLGKYRWTPPMGAKAYREVLGKKLYYRILLVPGYGPLTISDIALGETPVGEFGDAVKIEIREGRDTDAPLSLFTDDVYAEPMDVLLTNAGGWSSRTTLTNVDEISLDIMFPRLANITGSSSRSPLTVTVEVQYSPSGMNNWLAVAWEADGYPGLSVPGEITVTDNSTSEVWRGARFKVGQGQYDVRARRITADQTDNNKLDQVHWVALRSIRHTDPVQARGVARVALRIEATNELQGSLQPVRLTTEAWYNIYDPATSVWSMQISRSPAWAAADALINQNHNPRPKTSAQLDLDAFAAWAADCAGHGLNCDGVIDYGATVLSTFNDIAETGWGRFDINGTLFSVVWDRPIAAPSQHFSPHNTISFSREKLFPKRPHALHCHFMNAAKGYQRDMMAVYAPGYDAATSTLFEDREYHLVTDADQIKLTALREIRVSIYRDMKCELKCKMAHLVSRPGQLVSVTRPETGWGLGSGRVKSASLNDVNLTDGVPMLAGRTYSIAFIYADQKRKIFDLLPKSQDGEYTTVEFAAPDGQGGWLANPISAGDVPLADNMFQFGETSFVGRSFLIDKIDHARGELATLYLAPEGGEIFTFIQGSQPPYDSRLSAIPDVYRRPGAPVILSVASDEAVMIPLPGGGWQPRIVVSLAPYQGGDLRLSHLSARYRRSDGAKWTELPPLAATATEVAFSDVQQGVSYDLDFQAVTEAGISSTRSLISGHKVVGKSTLPPDVPELWLAGSKARWPYPSPPVDMAGWLVRSNAGDNREWSSAVPAHGGVLSAAEFDISGLPGGTRTIMVKAVDTDGNESGAAAAMIINLGDSPVANIIETVDLAAQGFPGLLTNGAVIGGILKADDTGGAPWTGDNNPAWTSDANPAWTSTYKQMVYRWTVVPGDTGAAITVAAQVTASAWTLEYRPDSQAPAWTGDNNPAWSGDNNLAWSPLGAFSAWPGRLDGLARSRYEFRLSTAAGTVRGETSSLAVNLDVPDIVESFSDLVIPIGGIRLPIVNTYRKIVVVGGIALQADGNGSDRVEVVDKDPFLGPFIKAYAAANPAIATIDVTNLQGY